MKTGRRKSNPNGSNIARRIDNEYQRKKKYENKVKQNMPKNDENKK